MTRHQLVITSAALVLCAFGFGCGSLVEKGPATIPDTPDGTVQFVAQKLANQQPQVIWDALPPSYQTDITEVVHSFAAKMDPELYNQVFSLAQKAVRILKEKKPYILESSMLQQEELKREDLDKSWDTGMSFLETFLSSEISQLEALKTIDIRQYLSTTGTELMTRAAESSANQPDDPYTTEFVAKLEQMKTEVVAAEGDSATLRVTVPDEEPEELKMLRVEGRWVPAEMAETWTEDVAEAKAKIAEIDDEKMAQAKMQAAMFIAMADSFLDQLAKVESSEELESMLSGLLGGFMGGGMGPDRDMPEAGDKG